VNLERARWMLRELRGDLVLVDIAGYRIVYFRGSRPVWRARVQVGRPYRSTPSFRSEITYFTFNPTWTLPPTILREDVLPHVRADIDYLARNRMRVLDRLGVELDPALVDWSRPEGLLLRQDAGPGNALGQVAIRFPNPHAVYLHDTPNKRLFEREQRAFSSGCIRVENPLELVELLLDDPERWDRPAIEALIATGRTRNVPLPRPVPILLLYWTVDVHAGGRIAFKPDIYGRDAPLLQALSAHRP
jgi:murein L,D-transpeptidase YcbB/YkuD